MRSGDTFQRSALLVHILFVEVGQLIYLDALFKLTHCGRRQHQKYQ
jgi:hypothetical protein